MLKVLAIKPENLSLIPWTKWRRGKSHYCKLSSDLRTHAMVCVCTHTHTCVHTCARIHTHVCTHVHAYTRTCVHICARTHIHVCTRTHVCTHVHAHTYMCTHMCTYTHIYSNIPFHLTCVNFLVKLPVKAGDTCGAQLASEIPGH